MVPKIYIHMKQCMIAHNLASCTSNNIHIHQFVKEQNTNTHFMKLSSTSETVH